MYNISDTKKILIIPDMHLEFEKAEFFIKTTKPSHIIFLGDYFDNFGDTTAQHVATAKWIEWSNLQKNRTHLIGNHDPYYFTRKECCWCSGNTKEKVEATKFILTPKTWNNLHTHIFINKNILLTHAGLAHNQTHPMLSVSEWMEREGKTYKEACQHNLNHPWLQWGSRATSGYRVTAGPLWCDYDDFVPIPELHQIFGHTCKIEPQIANIDGWLNINLDTGLTPQNNVSYPGGFATICNKQIEIFNQKCQLKFQFPLR